MKFLGLTGLEKLIEIIKEKLSKKPTTLTFTSYLEYLAYNQARGYMTATSEKIASAFCYDSFDSFIEAFNNKANIYIRMIQDEAGHGASYNVTMEGGTTDDGTKDYILCRFSGAHNSSCTIYRDKATNTFSLASAGVSNPVDKTDVLYLTNRTEYTPTSDYHPATKKYVDDKLLEIEQLLSEV